MGLRLACEQALPRTKMYQEGKGERTGGKEMFTEAQEPHSQNKASGKGLMSCKQVSRASAESPRSGATLHLHPKLVSWGQAMIGRSP